MTMSTLVVFNHEDMLDSTGPQVGDLVIEELVLKLPGRFLLENAITTMDYDPSRTRYIVRKRADSYYTILRVKVG